jgi:hypothetical protein
MRAGVSGMLAGLPSAPAAGIALIFSPSWLEPLPARSSLALLA